MTHPPPRPRLPPSLTISITFSPSNAGAPSGAPSSQELEAMGILGIELGEEGRTTLMNQISAALGIPRGGWHGQAKLFEGGDVRLRGLLARLTNAHRAQLIADNLARAGRYVDVNLLLVLVSAAREYGGSLTATGTDTINTYHQGGLD